jgi:ubiquinone/menaquinone biosynthesis C-methylase UbiE
VTQPDPTRYGREWAADYDLYEVDEETTTAALATIPRLAAGRPVLEVAAGTGRLAVPLAELGLDVTATDISPDMIAVLRAKDTRSLVRTRVEGMEDFTDPRRYGLVVNAWSSIFMLTTAELQQAAVTTAARHLLPGGLLTVEVNVMSPERTDDEQRVEFLPGAWGTVKSSYDPVTQRMEYSFGMPDGSRRDSVLRYVTVDELLAMGAAAGLVAAGVRNGWSDEPFTDGDPTAVLLLQRP